MNTLIENNSCLRGRSGAQIRSFLQHRCTRKKHNNSSSNIGNATISPRNRIPSNIYLHFKEYIKAKKIPTIEACIQKYGKSPSLNKFSPKNIQEFIQKAIEFS